MKNGNFRLVGRDMYDKVKDLMFFTWCEQYKEHIRATEKQNLIIILLKEQIILEDQIVMNISNKQKIFKLLFILRDCRGTNR